MEVKNMVNAILAAILSFFIPGLGQALAGDIKKGVIFFVIAIVLGFILGWIFGMGIITYIVALLYDLYAAYDAYNMAK